jgi:diaminohydroxyphosphoribosylaminopyrimidine deaminase / 5-amino-6-(5-phosphoribosylamino)uracil reductase
MPASRRQPELYMREALDLARRSPGCPYPNPWVGCVIVNGGRIVGRGFHRGVGSKHAEAEALRTAGPLARGATLYVTLEPCCHYGHTPPCSEAIIGAGIREVYYALDDPNPLVSGKSAKTLRAHGLLVRRGLCAGDARTLNEVYLKFRATGLPFITVKVATSLDGKIATRTGESKWITDAQARRRARQLRAEHQAVLVGIRTVLADNPHLGPRAPGAPEPWRVVLDSRLRIPLDSLVVKSKKCIVACAADASSFKKSRLLRCGVQMMAFRGKRVPLKPLLSRLAQMGIISVLVEGGAEVLGSFFDSGLVDRVFWFVAPVILGSAQSRVAVAGTGAARLAEANWLRSSGIEQIGTSWMVRGNLSRWARKA